MLRSIIVITALVISSAHSYTTSNSWSEQQDQLLIQEDLTDNYIKDLKTFVRSISKQKYQPEGYWEEVDVLWESIQERKQDLQSQFTGEQLKQIRKWEKRYQQIRRKRAKLS